MEALVQHRLSLTPDQVFRVDASSLTANVMRSGVRLVAGGQGHPEQFRGMVDTAPLRGFLERVLARNPDGTLPGVAENLAEGRLRAVALCGTSYTTSQSVTWVEGRDFTGWERPQRRGEHTRLTVDHVLASTALPLLFPAARVGNEWFGDGGIRLTAPLSPALHLGASRIITIATRYDRNVREASRPQVPDYPPPAQVLGVLYNAVFLDLIDQDELRLQRTNRLVARLPEEQRHGLRVVDMLVRRLIALGEEDAERQWERIAAFVEGEMAAC